MSPKPRPSFANGCFSGDDRRGKGCFCSLACMYLNRKITVVEDGLGGEIYSCYNIVIKTNIKV